VPSRSKAIIFCGGNFKGSLENDIYLFLFNFFMNLFY
jgi:hypothetical protein